MKKLLIFGSLFCLTSLFYAQTTYRVAVPAPPQAPIVGPSNSAFGVGALGIPPTGVNNTASGINAGLNVLNGSDNCFFGYNAGTSGGISGVLNGNKNVYVGSEGGGGGFFNANGNSNVAVGYRAGIGIANGSDRNVFIGAWATTLNTWAPPGNIPWRNVIAIGGGTQAGFTYARSATVMDSNNCILGNNDIHVGIGLSGRSPAILGNPFIGNKLEINADPSKFCIGCAFPPFTDLSLYNPIPGAFIPGSWPGGSTGASGLRFRDLTSASTPITTPGTGGVNFSKVLSVDQNGDVVLISPTSVPLANNGLSVSGGNVQLGATCNSPTVSAANLLSDRSIPLNNFNISIWGNGIKNKNRVYIGEFQNCTPGNKLEVDNDGNVPTPLSGLRLTDLASAAPLANNGQVLSVNPATGDVILTKASSSSGGCCIGNACNLPTPGTNPLPSDWEVPLGNFNYIFSKNAAQTGNVGIGALPGLCVPGNLLEVSRGLVGPVSGLRLTDLQSPAIPLPANGQVLSVDPLNGDVILTAALGGPSIGGYCPTPPANGLIGNSFQIPLNGFGYNFTTPVTSAGQVIIGQPLCTSPSARLTSEDDFFGNAIHGNATVAGINNIGVRGSALTNPTGANHIGVLGESQTNTASYGAGVVGFYGPAVLGAMPIGGGIGVYGNSISNPGGAWAGYFDGNTGFNGHAIPIGACAWNVGLPGAEWNKVYTCNGVSQTSDRRKKDNIKVLDYGLKEIMKLNPVSYNWKNNPNGERKIGFIAQELREVISEVVNEGNDENKTLSVNYAELVALLTKGMQEQQKQIDELKTLVQSLTGTNNSGESRNGNSSSVTLTDKNIIVLNQNVPNPFAENTTITYNIPNDFTKAQLIFSTTEGKVIKAIEITSKGPGRLSVFANDLSSGMYSYTLIVDGKTIDTKKMVKE